MKGADTGSTAGHSRTRRDVLGTVGATGALVLAGCTGDDSGGDGNGGDDNGEDGGNGTDDGGTRNGTGEDTVSIGLSLSLSGARNNEGEQMRQGYELAASQINAGTGAAVVEPFTDISEDGGVLGRQIELVVEDSESTGDGARASAQTLTDQDVVVFTGGASAEEGISHQQVAAETETLYMGGFTPTAAVSGEHCTRYAFNEMYNATMAADSLAPIVAREMGIDDEVNFAQLYPDNRFGEEFSTEIRTRFESVSDSWFHQVRTSTREGERSYEVTIEEVLSTDPDLVILNYYGLTAANAIRDFVEVDDQGTQVVVPVFNRQFARTAGSAIEGVIGTVHWPPEPPGQQGWGSIDISHPFRDTFLANWDVNGSNVPSPVAHLAYVQLCQYAAAAERAGTFDTDAIIAELEDHTYAYGMGDQTLRTCDHQAMRTVPVVVGLPEADHRPGSFFQLSKLQASLGLGGSEPYTCDESPAAGCDMG